jgi:hypothetical protein
MINFRFHIISLVAVFLALALGIFLGSAVGEPAIVETLNDRIDDVREFASDLDEENNRLRADNAQLEAFIEQSAVYTVEDRLANVDVAVVAERGVDDNPIDAMVDLLVASGANAPMVVWVEPRWQLENDDDVATLADIIDSPSTLAREVRREAFDALALRLTRPVADAPADTPPTNETTVPTTGNDAPPDLLQQLVEANFLSIDGIELVDVPVFPAARGRALVIDGPDGDIDDPQVFSQSVSAFANAEAPTVAAEVTGSTDPNAPGRGATVAAVRGDDALDAVVSTVDNLDVTQGRVTAVLALQQVETVGDYGDGRGASRSVPEPQAS